MANNIMAKFAVAANSRSLCGILDMLLATSAQWFQRPEQGAIGFQCVSLLLGLPEEDTGDIINNTGIQCYSQIRKNSQCFNVLFKLSLLLKSETNSIKAILLDDDNSLFRIRNNSKKIDFVDGLFLLALKFAAIEIKTETSSSSNTSYLVIHDFTFEMMKIPLLTSLLSPKVLSVFVKWPYFNSVVGVLAAAVRKGGDRRMAWDEDRYMHSEGRRNSGLESGHWILGNVLTLFSPLSLLLQGAAGSSTTASSQAASATSSHDAMLFNDASMMNYFQLCVSLMDHFGVGGILQGQSGVTVRKDDQHSSIALIATGFPFYLKQQYLSICDSKAHLVFSNRIFGDVVLCDDTYISSRKRQDDLDNISSALKSNSIQMTNRSMMEEVTTANSWFGSTSKWAQSVSTSLSTTSTSFLSMFSSKPKRAAAAIPVVPVGANPTSNGTVNMKLISCFCSFWASMLPLAASANVDSAPWKAVSSISFSADLLSKLWYCAVQHNIDAFAKNFPADSSSCYRHDNNDSSLDGFRFLICLVSLMKTCLIAVDDAELYEIGVSYH